MQVCCSESDRGEILVQVCVSKCIEKGMKPHKCAPFNMWLAEDAGFSESRLSRGRDLKR